MPKKFQAPALRQSNCRDRAFQVFGVRPVTLLLTPPELAMLRQAFMRKLSHDWTLKSRREHAASKSGAVAVSCAGDRTPKQTEINYSTEA
jgi:hypothetical protein